MISHLEIHAPSATTIEYTVSNKRHPASKTWTAARHGIRAIVVAHLVLLNLLKADTLIVVGASSGLSKLPPVSLVEPLFRHLSAKADWPTLAVANLIIIYLCLRRYYIEESLLVLQGLGIQTSTTSPYYFLSPTTTFIPTTRIQDIVIHEAFKGLEVRFYLAVIVDGATEVVVVFPTLLPRLNILQQVWKGARNCLYANEVKPG